MKTTGVIGRYPAARAWIEEDFGVSEGWSAERGIALDWAGHDPGHWSETTSASRRVYAHVGCCGTGDDPERILRASEAPECNFPVWPFFVFWLHRSTLGDQGGSVSSNDAIGHGGESLAPAQLRQCVA